MIYYNNNTINDWFFSTDNIIKVYRNNAICYYKIDSSSPSGQTPCFAVVDDITQYSDTEFEDVFNKADGKWYKLNNLDEYEEYGVYGSGRSITYYQGKLTIDGDYEYIYSGSSWNNVGEVSGSSRLPAGYTEVEYIENTTNAYLNLDVYLNTSNFEVGYDILGNWIKWGYTHQGSGGGTWITVESSTAFFGSYNNRRFSITTDTNENVIKYESTNGLTVNNTFYSKTLLVGSDSIASIPLYVFGRYDFRNRSVDSGSNVKLKSFYLKNDSTLVRDLVPCTRKSDNMVGMYDIVNDVFYGSADSSYSFVPGAEVTGQTIYPMYYDELQDPPDNLSFSSMTEAEEYECPWVGMTADIDGTDYIFDVNYLWVTKYNLFEVSGEYICDGDDKYQKMEEKIRNVDDSWSSQYPPVYEKGELIESASTDCHQPIDYTKEYLTFEPISSAVTFAYKKATVNYSLDSGTTWNSITTSQTVTVNVGQKIMWKATLGSSSDDGKADRFVTSGGTWKAYGNLLSMQGGDNFSATTTINEYTLHWLFYQCSSLVDIDNLKIPATSGGTNTLRATFRGCGFTTVPSDLLLSITGFTGSQVYMGMFEDCVNLTASPILPATNIPNYGYFAMFNNCPSLTACTCLATSNIGGNRTQIMLNGVASSGIFYKHPNATWQSGQYGYPSTWTVENYNV